MKPTNMSLVTCEVDLRAGGSFRWVFQRPNGARIEVRGVCERVDPPRLFAYTETYDFSPLKVLVTTVLEQARRDTLFKHVSVCVKTRSGMKISTASPPVPLKSTPTWSAT